MKLTILSLITFLFIFVTSSLQISAETILFDDFNTTISGDVNTELERQTGSAAPISYSAVNGPSTVTNAGQYSGTCYMHGDPTPSYLSPLAVFKESGKFSVEYEIDRVNKIDTNKWDAFSFGTDGHFNYPHEAGTNGLELLLWEHGFYNIFINNNAATGNFYFAELQSSSNSNLKIKFVVSQPDFGTPGDALISLFINDRPYPIVNVGTDVRFLINQKGGFANNLISFLTAWTEATIDNFKFTTFTDKNFVTASWTDVADSGISSSKTYTHAVNFCNEADVAINGVTFKGSPSNNTAGSNWELKNDQNVIQLAQYGWGANANLSPECIPLVSNCLYDAWTSGGLTLKGLNTNLQYIITLYSMGLDPGSRPSYLIPSDGDAITAVDQNEFGDRNGQIVTYKYSPSADGVFSIATASDRGSNWVWYAFSNEIIPPEMPGNISASKGTFSDKVRVSWDAAVGAEDYTVYRAETNVFSFASVLSSNITATIYDDSSALQKYYYYWVQADSQGGSSAALGPELGFISTSSGPDKPVNTSPTGMEEVNAPVTFLATVYSDPGGYKFKASQWQISELSDFSSIEWSSGNTIPENSFTAPAAAISTQTNYWRVRYENEFNTWSEWSEGTLFILIPLPVQSVTFSDSFNVPGSGNVNNEYDYPCRQDGNYAPLTYKVEGDTKTGGSSEEAGWLTLGKSSGCSPNHSFTESGNFNIEFDVKPDMLAGEADWASISFGKSSQDDFFPVSSSGLANIFYSHGWMHTYSGENMVGNTFGIPIAEELHVMITVGTEDFESEPVSISTYINDQPVIVDTTTLENLGMPLYAYIKSGGFYENYVTLYNNGDVATQPSLFDNLSIYPAPDCVNAYQWTGDADSLVNSSKTYTHKINLNGDDVTINSVTFNGTGFHPAIYNNGNAMITTSTWALTASGNALAFFDGTPGANLLTGSSHDLANYFAFPHGSFGFHLSGLEPYSSNTFYVYTIGFETGVREGQFSSSYGGAITNINQDEYDLGGGIIITYDYVASKDGEFSMAITPANQNTNNTACFHVSGFANVNTGELNPKTLVDCIINFGDVSVGDNKILPMVIANEGGGIVSGSIAGSALPFSLDTNVYLATALTSDVINIDFTPDTESVYTNVISLIGNDGTTQVLLTGTGVPEPGILWIIGLLAMKLRATARTLWIVIKR